MDYEFQIYRMSNLFYNAYPSSQYPEILAKSDRVYSCLLIDMHCDYFICVPYRSDIRHNNAFKFKHTNRSKTHQSGLDFTKIVIVKNNDYLSANSVAIDNDEYIQTIINMQKIVSKTNNYVETYIKHINGENILSSAKYDRLYKYSTLKYFHKELGLSENTNKQLQFQINNNAYSMACNAQISLSENDSESEKQTV